MPCIRRSSQVCRLSLLLVGLLPALGYSESAMASAPATPGARIQLVLALVADDGGLARFAHAVSTPGSPQYGHYEPVPWLAQRFGASPLTQSRALRFLRRAGAADISMNGTGLFAQATFTVRDAERAFGADLRRVAGGSRGSDRFIAPAPSARASAAAAVPAGLRGVATGVIGLDNRPVVLGARRRAHASARGGSGYAPATGTPSGCSAGVATGGFTPNQYVTAYGISPLRASGLGGQGERVALIEVDGFKYSDLRTYAACFGLNIPRLNVYSVGLRRLLPPGGESTLDLEVVDSVAPNLSAIDVYENSGDAAAVTRSLVLPLLAPGAKPQVISASLGLCEPSIVAAFGRAGVSLLERDIELSAAAGITLIASSGDTGSSSCVDSKGRIAHRLAVSFPASSPFVTAVGGTNLALTATNAIAAQVVWNDTPLVSAAGGGGFSQLFGRPAYQRRVISGPRRVLPDVAMLADLGPGYAIFCTAAGDPQCSSRRSWETVGGTSAAAPLLAAGTALVDQDLARRGQPALGFLNPLLYAIGSSPAAGGVFADVTNGGNDIGAYLPGARGKALGCCRAKPGFDAASGWGGVNLAGLDLVAQASLPRLGQLTVSLPGAQRPGRGGVLKVRLGCSQACSVYAFSIFTLGNRRTFTVRSAIQRRGRAGSFTVSIRLSRSQQRALNLALAQRLVVRAEVFGVGLDGRGHAANVTSGVVHRIRA